MEYHSWWLPVLNESLLYNHTRTMSMLLISVCQNFNFSRPMYWKKNLLLIPVTEKKTKVFVFTTFSPSNKWTCSGFSQYYYLELSYKKKYHFRSARTTCEFESNRKKKNIKKTKFLSWKCNDHRNANNMRSKMLLKT